MTCVRWSAACAGAWDQVELTIQRSSQLPDHISNVGHQNGAEQQQHLHQHQLMQQQPTAQQQQQPQQPQEALHDLTSDNGLYEQPVARIFAAAQPETSNMHHRPLNGQLGTSNGQQQNSIDAVGYPNLPGAGSQPILLKANQSCITQGQRPPGQGQTPGPEEGEGSASAGGLQKDAEEKLRGLSRLEEDALEAKVAGPIGNISCS